MISQFEKSEVMLEYARLVKEAGWRDVIDVLGLDAAIAGAGAVGGMAAGTGALSGAATALGLSGPPGWIIIGVLGLGATAYFAIQAAQKTNDNLIDLVGKLEALDTTPASEGTVQEWINTLTSYQQYFVIQEVPEDPGARAKQAGEKISNMVKVLDKLKAMQRTWPQVKATLTDWGWDDTQAEEAINQTAAAIETQLSQLRQSAQQDADKVLAETGGETGLDYKDLSEKLLWSYNQIKQISGQPPVPDNVNEQQALGLARAISNNQPVTKEQLTQYGPYLQSSVEALQQLLAKSQSTKASAKLLMSKRAGVLPLSKRSWRLYNEPPKGKGQVGGQRRKRGKDTDTLQLQKNINHLNVALKTGIGRIAEDGIYGERTAGALKGLMDSNASISGTFRRYGIDDNMVLQPNVMRQSDAIGKASAILSKMVSTITGKTPAETREREVKREGALSDLERRRDLNDEEILYYINNKVVANPFTGNRATIREHINASTRNMPGILRDKYRNLPGRSSAVKLIKQVFFTKGQTAPIEWDMALLFQALRGGRYGNLF